MALNPRLCRSAGLALVMGFAACGDETIDIPYREFAGHYTSSLPNQMQTGVDHFEIQPNFTVAYTVEGSCGEYRSQTNYAWEAVDDDEILITSANGGWIDGTYKIRVTLGTSCDQLTFEHFTSEFSLYTYEVHRGKLCLPPSGQQCFTTWCDGPPEPCSSS